MEKLSTQISAQVKILVDAVRQLGTDEPSFENGIPKALLGDRQASAARQAVLALTDELHALLSDPEQLLAAQTNPAISAHAITQLGLVRALPINSPGRSIEDMANEAGLPVNLARRLMKHAAAHRIYREYAPGVFGHTAASKVLAEDEDCQKWLCAAIDDVAPASYKIPKAIRKYGFSGEPNQCGWNVEHGLSRSVFQELGDVPERGENFAAAMRFIAKNPGFDLSHLFIGFDWQTLSGKTLTDVGGSAGHASIYLAERVHDLHCVVQDRQEVIEMFENSTPPHLADRITFEAHSLFQDQTRQSDAFLLRLILHDWSQDYAQNVLKALIPGMKPGTRVLIQDMILPRFGDPVSHFHQKIMRGFDLNMLGLQNGQERDIDDWQSLATNVDARLKLANVYQDLNSVFGLLEFIWT